MLQAELRAVSINIAPLQPSRTETQEREIIGALVEVGLSKASSPASSSFNKYCTILKHKGS